ncbi:MAG: hypothetical protein J1F29_07010 [Lentimicrobiaceae bacterium]|nr:hypothetical protein [Lentimicrobiaceae bacterium]
MKIFIDNGHGQFTADKRSLFSITVPLSLVDISAGGGHGLLWDDSLRINHFNGSAAIDSQRLSFDKIVLRLAEE